MFQKHSKKSQNFNIQKTVKHVCHAACMSGLYIFQRSSQSVQKWLSYRPKSPKISISKIYFFNQSMHNIKIKKHHWAPREIVHQQKAFNGKNSSFEILPFSPVFLIIIFWPLSWPWPHIWPFEKNFKHSPEPPRYELSIDCRFPRISTALGFLVDGGRDNIYPPPQRRAFDWRP